MNNGTKAVIGIAAWIGFLLAVRAGPSSPAWTHGLIVLAALVLVPLALDLVAERRDTGRIGKAFGWAVRAQLPAAVLLAISCVLQPGWWALLAAVPWATVTALLASAGIGRMLRDSWSRPLDRLSGDVGLGFLVIGGLWLLVDRAGLKPLGFHPEIVALTAAHFHFAGFLLPVYAGQVMRGTPESRFAARAIVGIVLGVPAVAAGITATQLGWTPAIEAAAGCGMALAGASVAVLHVRWSLDAREMGATARTLVGIAGVSLFFAMVLSAAYAIRSYAAPVAWLGLPQMRAMYGTLLAFGFGLCGAAGWRRVQAILMRATVKGAKG